MVPFDSCGAVFYSLSVETITLSCISSKIKRDIDRKSWFFFIFLAFDAPVRGVSVGIFPSFVWCGKTGMVGLSNGEKTEDMCNRLDRIPACDGQIDRQTDGRTDILPRHSPRYALHTRRAVKFVKCKLSNCECCIQTHRVSAGRATKSFHIFTARRVCIARTTPSQDVRPSVCLSVCLSVTLRYSV